MSNQLIKMEVAVKMETIECLTNYIMSVQSMVDRINIMERDNSLDTTHLQKRIDVIQQFEDEVLSALSGIYSQNK